MSALALLAQLPAMAVQNVMLSWNPSSVPGVAGYKVYFGGTSGNYTSMVDAGNATNVTISGLADGSTNYFSATTYDASTNESALSDEVIFVTPLTVSNPVVTVPIDTTPTNSTTTSQPSQQPVLHVVGGLTVATNPADIHSVVLSWTPSTDAGVAGYQIFGGKATGNYSLFINVYGVNSLVITGLVSGTTNFFAVREFDAAWNQNDISPEVQWVVPFPSTNPVVIIPTPTPTNSTVIDPTITNSPPTNSTSSKTVISTPPPTNAIVANTAPILNAVSNLVASVNPYPADPRNVTLTWNASTDAGVTGYKIFLGSRSGVYTVTQKVAMVSSLLITGLVYNTTNYFAVQEFSSSTNLGGRSEIRWVVPVRVNIPPTINPLADLNLNINAAQQTVNMSGISCGLAYESQLVTVTVSSSNTGLIPTPKVTYTNPSSTGSLTFKPVAGKTGTAVITVSVDDNAINHTNHIFTRSFTVNVVDQTLLAAMPKFATQLKGARVLKNQPVVFSVAMSGQAPFKYQWKYNGTNLPGQTSATFSIPAAKLVYAGAYMVQVSNSAGVTNSVVATLTVFTNTTPTMVTPTIPQPGRFSFQVPAEVGLKYVVEATTDFQQWTPVLTNTAPFTFTDTNAASYTHRYYRTRYLP